MRKLFSKILVCALIALCAISSASMFLPVQANSEISPCSYDNLNFSYAGRCNVSRDCTGMFLDVTVKATASNNNNETITLDVFVVNTGKTHSYTFLSDGQNHTYKNIFLGFSGGSNVAFTFTGANPAITIYQNLEITS